MSLYSPPEGIGDNLKDHHRVVDVPSDLACHNLVALWHQAHDVLAPIEDGACHLLSRLSLGHPLGGGGHGSVQVVQVITEHLLSLLFFFTLLFLIFLLFELLCMILHFLEGKEVNVGPETFRLREVLHELL